MIEISPVASLHMLLSKKGITKDAQAGLRLYCSQIPEDRFFRVEAHLIKVMSSGIILFIN